MKTTFIAAIAALFGASALAAPAASSCKIDSTFAIDGFTTRTYDGQNLSTVFFNIKATNSGTLDFECSPHNEVSGKNIDTFKSGRTYSCGENSFFSFRYLLGGDGEKDLLVLSQDVSDTKVISGAVVVPEPTICNAGGTGVNDQICMWAPSQSKNIAMKTL